MQADVVNREARHQRLRRRRTPRPALRRLLIIGAVAAGALSANSGCVGPSARDLREAAQSLVPPGSDIVAQIEADCVELARSPSCVHVYFLPEVLARREREAAVEAAARAGDWELVRRERFIGGSQLRFRRGGLRAVVNLWPDENAARCRRAPNRDCADSAFVEAE